MAKQMTKQRKKEAPMSERVHYRTKDIADRYECSRSYIPTLIEKKIIPSPLIIGGIKRWPAKLIQALDRQRENEYLEMLKSQGFDVPKSLAQ